MFPVDIGIVMPDLWGGCGGYLTIFNVYKIDSASQVNMSTYPHTAPI